jgi:hypothetical protein
MSRVECVKWNRCMKRSKPISFLQSERPAQDARRLQGHLRRAAIDLHPNPPLFKDLFKGRERTECAATAAPARKTTSIQPSPPLSDRSGVSLRPVAPSIRARSFWDAGERRKRREHGGAHALAFGNAAQALVKFMSSPEAAPLNRKSGMEPLRDLRALVQ